MNITFNEVIIVKEDITSASEKYEIIRIGTFYGERKPVLIKTTKRDDIAFMFKVR
ncbi:hypothetical protein [Bacillus cytotoxicus]|uniref:SunI/YnzG family protein n=1 Tax=Bacillus cytotoxicus TaxID=580165 RepID=UPI003B96870C